MVRSLSFFILAVLICCTAARADNFGLFQRSLEIGDFETAQGLISKLAKPGSPDETFLKSQIAFFQHDYVGAKKILNGMDAKGFEKVVNDTAEKTANFEKVETEHFVIKFAPGKDAVLGLYAGDVLEKAYHVIGSDLGVSLKAKGLVEFYPSWKDFMLVSTLTEKEVRTSGTIALCKFNRISVTTPRAMLLGYDWMDTLAHEFTHDLINRASNVLAPVWLHEGIAKYEEVRWRKAEGGEIPARSAMLLGRRLRAGTLIPFEKLHPSIAKLPTQEDAELAFAQVFFFIRYLVEANGGMEKIRRLLHTIGQGIAVPAAFETVYGKPFDGIYADWLVWLKKVSFPTNAGPPRPLQFQEDASHEIQAIKDEKARGWVRIGDLLMEKKRFGAALTEFEKAQGALNDVSPFLLNKISLVAFSMGQNEKALNNLSRAIERDPSYVTSYVRRGAIRLQAKDLDAAEDDFLKANSLNPFDPTLHAGLAKIYEARGDKKNLERERQAVRILEESRR